MSRARACLSLIPIFPLVLCLAFLSRPSPVVAQSLLELNSSTAVASEGFLTISWRGDTSIEQPASIEVFAGGNTLQPIRSHTLNSQIREKTQIHLSGFRDGEYLVRLVDATGNPLSLPLTFEVRHRSLYGALALFVCGAVLFLLLVGLLWRFNRSEVMDD